MIANAGWKHSILFCLAVAVVVVLQSTTGWLSLTPPPTRQYLFISKARYHVKNVVRQLDQRHLFEHLLPQSNKDLLWEKVSRALPSEWDVLWSFNAIRWDSLPHLSPNHRINHIPGNGNIVMKPELWKTVQDMNAAHFMPRHFMMPADAEALKRAWPSSNWITKSVTHRGVVMLNSVQEIDKLTQNQMVAEYVEPLLIDNRKWDIGVYVVVTSLEPLTIYIYDNVLLRFCKQSYPTDGKITEKTPLEAYVVNDYIPPWDVPHLKPGYRSNIPSSTMEGMSNWDVLNNYLWHNNNDVVLSKHQLRDQINRIVTTTLQHVAPTLLSKVKSSGGWPDTFFELWRWDFVVSKDGQVKIMEVNMSPNLKPKVFKTGTDEMMKRRLTKNLFQIIGAGGYDAATMDLASKYELFSQRSIAQMSKSHREIAKEDTCVAHRCKGCPNTMQQCFICFDLCYQYAPLDVRKKMKKLMYGYLGKGNYRLMVESFQVHHAKVAKDRSGEDAMVEEKHDRIQHAAAWLFGSHREEVFKFDDPNGLPQTYYSAPLRIPRRQKDEGRTTATAGDDMPLLLNFDRSYRGVAKNLVLDVGVGGVLVVLLLWCGRQVRGSNTRGLNGQGKRKSSFLVKAV